MHPEGGPLYPIAALAQLCAEMTPSYKVSLEYGNNSGDAPHWQIQVRLPLWGIALLRNLARGDDTALNNAAVVSLSAELKNLKELNMECTDARQQRLF